MSTINQLQRRIMRRVYYAFGIRLATSPVVVHGVLLFAALYALKVLVSITSIINNLRQIQLGNLDNYIFHAFMHAQFWTLVVIGIMFFTMLSLNFSLKAPRQYGRMQTVRI